MRRRRARAADITPPWCSRPPARSAKELLLQPRQLLDHGVAALLGNSVASSDRKKPNRVRIDRRALGLAPRESAAAKLS